MKIVITNVYCYLNKGDAGIVNAMIENIRKLLPDSDIKIISLYPSIDQGKYVSDVEIVGSPIAVDAKQRGIKKIFNNVRCFFHIKKSLRSGKLDTAEQVIKDADIVISCGGGYMQSFNIKHFLTDFIYHYTQLYITRFYKKPYYIFAQTIGPFSKITKKLVAPIINDATAVFAREKISFDYVKANFDNKNVVLTSDVAFLLNSQTINNFQIKKNGTNVGVTLRSWNFPNHINAQHLKDKYQQSIVEFIDWLTRNDTNVFIMPQCIGPSTDNDLIISNKIYNKIQNKNKVKVVDKDLTPGQLKYLYGKMDYFVGTRMHSNIFSLSEGIPCLAISYDPKTDGIMELFGLSDYVIDINEIDTKKLIQTFKKLVQNKKEVKNKIDKKLIDIKDNAFDNFQRILDAYEKDKNYDS